MKPATLQGKNLATVARRSIITMVLSGAGTVALRTEELNATGRIS